MKLSILFVGAFFCDVLAIPRRGLLQFSPIPTMPPFMSFTMPPNPTLPPLPFMSKSNILREGDILAKNRLSRNAVDDPSLLWPNNTVPYQLSNLFSVSEKAYILKAMQEIERGSCVRFRNYNATTDEDVVYIAKNCDAEADKESTDLQEGCPSSCFSPIGRQGGKQIVNLREGCGSDGQVAHDLMHTLGFEHQHNYPNRDEYIRINWDNINEDNKWSFEKYDSAKYTDFDFPYDYLSIMHYGRKVFSANGEDTITPLENVEIGRADKLSKIDFEKLKMKYPCGAGDVAPTKSWFMGMNSGIGEKFLSLFNYP